MNYNKAIMGGHLTRDPVMKDIGVCEFGIATNFKFVTKQGEEKQEACFQECEAWGSVGENIVKYCGKGRPLLVEGRLMTQSWQTPQGDKRSKNVLKVQSFTFVGPPPQTEPTSEQAEPQETDDDIPF